MISVLIPVHNGELYLAETIQSVLSQSYQDFEIIVVDDGSTDKTAQVVAGFFPRVIYYYQPNCGIGATRNRLVELAAGDFLAFIDADDCWTTDKLDLQMSELKNDSRLEAVFGMIRQVLDDNWKKALSETFASPDELIAGYSLGTVLIRSESFRRVCFFPTEIKVGEFIDWYLRAQEVGLKTKLVPKLMLRRRIHKTNQGIVNRASATDYVKIIKQSLDRRRAAQTPFG